MRGALTCLVGLVLVGSLAAQSNYNQQIVSANYTDEAVQERAHVNGTVVELGMFSFFI